MGLRGVHLRDIPRAMETVLSLVRNITSMTRINVKLKFIVWLRSKSLSFEFSELDFA